LIIPAAAVLQEWAQEQGLGEKPLPELITLPEVQTLYQERVAQSLRTLAPYEQVRKFILLPEPFTFARGEMTVTAKLRRRQIVARYKDQLEALYREGNEEMRK